MKSSAYPSTQGRQPDSATEVAFRGQSLLHQPLLNKGTAFTATERLNLGLEGLLPAKISTMEQQVRRCHEAIQRKVEPLEKYTGLVALQDCNEHLFYRLLLEHLEELLPIIYTPTVGLACQQFSHIFRHPRGMWITPDHRGRIKKVLANAPSKDIRLIVVTDNERILGLGDLGAGGIGIPIGKLALYTVAAGIHPSRTLAISLDVGTDNQELLKDDLYIGWRHPRLRGQEYMDLVEEFVEAVRRTFPATILQWEDFKSHHAFPLLEMYRNRLPSFNDDIQGTGAIAAAAVLSAARITRTRIDQQRILIVGAGTAGIGIAQQLRTLLQRHGRGEDDLHRCVAIADHEGLLHRGRKLCEPWHEKYAWPIELAQQLGLATDPPASLLELVRVFHPTVLIGASGQPGLFTEPIVRLMAGMVHRPVILPLSNPTSKSEATPQDLIAWTDGRAIIATGSPFAPVQWNGRTIRIGQANNIYVFPGIGLGSLVLELPIITDSMFAAAASALAEQVTEPDLAAGLLFPPLSRLREVTREVARAVISQAMSEHRGIVHNEGAAEMRLATAVWYPNYPTQSST